MVGLTSEKVYLRANLLRQFAGSRNLQVTMPNSNLEFVNFKLQL